jgi:hypothetical protein
VSTEPGAGQIAELQAMVGAGVLAIVPEAIIPAVIERVLKPAAEQAQVRPEN